MVTISKLTAYLQVERDELCGEVMLVRWAEWYERADLSSKGSDEWWWQEGRQVKHWEISKWDSELSRSAGGGLEPQWVDFQVTTAQEKKVSKVLNDKSIGHKSRIPTLDSWQTSREGTSMWCLSLPTWLSQNQLQLWRTGERMVALPRSGY